MSTILRGPHQSAFNKSLSAPELWLHGVFDFLPFREVLDLQAVSRDFLSLSKGVANLSKLGIFPSQIWLHHILPLLTHSELKKFQRVSRVARILTLSKPLSAKMFRSDVNSERLDQVKNVFDDKLQKGEIKYARYGVSAGLKNPILDRLDYSLHQDYSSIAMYHDNCPPRHECEATYGVEIHPAFLENATNPAVPSLKLEISHHQLDEFWVEVKGTGRSLFGGVEKAVTCKDVIKALVRGNQEFQWCEFSNLCLVKGLLSRHCANSHFPLLDDGDHTYYEGLGAFYFNQDGFVMFGARWGS